MTLFSGLSAFPITPCDADGCVLDDDLARLVDRLRPPQVQSVAVLGSTGTYAYLSRVERRRAIATAALTLEGRVPLIAGVGALRTDAAMALARDAEAAGADGLLLAPVSYTPLTDDEVYRHFSAVAGATGLPLCLYNNPTATHFTFTPALIARIAALPTVAAVKMPLPAHGDIAADLATLRATLPGTTIGYSGDWGCPAALAAGADAWFSVIAGLLPGPAARLVRAARAPDTLALAEAAFQPLWTLMRAHGGVRVMHAAANLLGLTRADPPRPILPLGPADTRAIAAALDLLQARSPSS